VSTHLPGKDPLITVITPAYNQAAFLSLHSIWAEVFEAQMKLSTR